MRNREFYALAFLALLASGCLYTGGSPSDSPLANSAAGAAAVVTVGSQVYEGELLAVTSADLTMLTSTGVIVIPFPQIDSGWFPAIDVRIAGIPSPTKLDQLRYASRFPYGIKAPVMNAILTKMGRSAPDTARPQ